MRNYGNSFLFKPIYLLINAKEKHFLPLFLLCFIFSLYLCTRKRKECRNHNGALAQLVEHRTENPCVPGSIPGGTTPPFISPVSRDGGRVSFLPKQLKLWQ